MKIAFTTLGCPMWDLDSICKKGRECGFDGVDFRGLRGQINVTLSPEFTRDLALTKRKLADARIVVSGVSSSIKLCEASRLRENIEEARRTIPIARELGVAAIRVFGGGDVEVHSKEELAAIGERTMAAELELDGARTLRWAFERYVTPGTGQLPLAEGIRLLRKQRYDGWLIFEHEKRWHPELPEPEETLPQFVTWIRGLLE